MNRKLQLVFSAFATLLLVGCVSITWPEDPITSLAEVPGDRVLLVGKISLNPPLRDSEKNLNIANDWFDTAEAMSNRAIMGFNARKNLAVEKAGFLINPPLDETFFYSLPRDRVNMIGGYITVSFSHSVTGARSVMVNHGKVLLPNFSLDIKPADQIIYMGTLRLERSDFNDVTKVSVIDEYTSAVKLLKRKFGVDRMRKVLPTG